MTNPLTLLNLMAAKLCHDIATPLGALGLGLEMLGEGGVDQDTRDLLLTASETAKLRLRLYRAFLSHGANSPTFAETKDILSDLCRNSGIELVWEIKVPMLPDGLFCKLLLGGALIMLEALIKGGYLAIHIKPSEAGFEWMLAAEGPMAQFRPGYVDVLKESQPLERQTSRTILPFYVQLLASQDQKKIDCEQENPHKLYLALC